MLELKSELNLSNMYAYGKLYKLITLHQDKLETRMEACLETTSMFCSRQKVIGLSTTKYVVLPIS